MSETEPTPERQMAQFLQWTLPVLTSGQAETLGGLFSVPPSQIKMQMHPMNNDRGLLTIKFLQGINVAAALASFFNRTMYQIPKHEQTRELGYEPNGYAFVGTDLPGETLCLTVSGTLDDFIDHLQRRAEDIKYVKKNPRILFMMRPDIDYPMARANLQRGLQPGF